MCIVAFSIKMILSFTCLEIKVNWDLFIRGRIKTLHLCGWVERWTYCSLTLAVYSILRLSGLSPFQGETNEETLRNVMAMNYEFDARYFSMTSSMAKDFIQKLLVKNPK